MFTRLRRFLSYYKPYRGLLAADIACAMVTAGTSLLFPLIVRYITKNVLETGMADPVLHILYAAGAMLVLIAIQAGCMYFYDYRGHAMGAMMERDMRAELFAQYQKLSFSYHDAQKPGQLMSRLTHDLLSLAEFCHHGPEDLVINSVKFIGAGIILFLTNVKLAWVVIAFLPAIAIFAMTLGVRVNRAVKRNLEQIGEVDAMVEESLSGIRVTQSFVNEAMENRKFAKQNNLHLLTREHTYRSEAVFYTGVESYAQLISMAVVVVGGISIARGTLDLADLLTFVLYVGYLVTPVTRLANTMQQYQEGIAGFNRFLEMMDMAPDIADAPDAKPQAGVHGDISFQDVGFCYDAGNMPVFEHVTLNVKAGETIAIVGHSGVGKTTLCSLIPRFYDVSSGAIFIDGQDIRGVTLQSLRCQVGIVQQDVYLFSGTVLENIQYGKPGAEEAEIVQAARLAGAHDFIMEMPEGYQTQIGHRGVRLSGGQKQRLSIARVFLKDPPILILDEATSALDNESEQIIQHSLDVLTKGRTTLIIAHRLSTIRNADRIVLLSERGIAEEGTHAALMQKDGAYMRLYQNSPDMV